MLELSKEEKALVVSYIYARCGIDLKTKEYLVASKVGLECFKRHISSFQEFWLKLSGHDAEAAALQQCLIDNFFFFFDNQKKIQNVFSLLFGISSEVFEKFFIVSFFLIQMKIIPQSHRLPNRLFKPAF